MTEVYIPTKVELYEVSNYGNVRRILLGGGYKAITGSVNNRGYRYFQIQRDGQRNNHLFHQLVAEAFIGERPEGLVVDHIDRDKLNNSAANLRYISFTENIRNSSVYYDHIDEPDLIKRRNLLERQRRLRKSGGVLSRNPPGAGYIHKTIYNTWAFSVRTNYRETKITFKTREEAEDARRKHIDALHFEGAPKDPLKLTDDEVSDLLVGLDF